MPDFNRAGFIGVGMMGHGMARNLVEKGFPLTILGHRNRVPVEDLVRRGAVEAADGAALAAAADVVFLCVTGGKEVNAVLGGSRGVLEGLRPGAVVVDTSTNDPATAIAAAAAVEARGGRFIDAPLSRGPREAEAGRLNVIAGGAAETLAMVRPMIDTFAENVVHAGPVGSGQRMKLLHNFIALGNAVLLAEAFACAAKAGMNVGSFCDVLHAGGGGSKALDRLRPLIEREDDTWFGAPMAIADKDIRACRRLADDLGIAAPGLDAACATIARLIGEGHAAAQISRLVDIVSAWNGAPPPRSGTAGEGA